VGPEEDRRHLCCVLRGRGGRARQSRCIPPLGRSTQRAKTFVLSSQAPAQGTEASAGAVHIPAPLVTKSLISEWGMQASLLS